MRVRKYTHFLQQHGGQEASVFQEPFILSGTGIVSGHSSDIDTVNVASYQAAFEAYTYSVTDR